MSCTERTLDFIIKEDDPEAIVVEDDIREDLEKIGIKVNTISLDADAYSEAERDGSYHMLLTRTWVREHFHWLEYQDERFILQSERCSV